ncbi:MAG: sulfocyanin-like copper-binding protein, partial [Acidobacteriota bacterium]
GGMNFNGASGGGLTLTVPAHWTVILHFRNNDQVLPHSAMVIAAVTPVPVSGAKPAVAHAVTRQAEQGLPPDGHEDVQFVADRAGSYLFYCAVPGHGAAGMWIRLEVSDTARQPELAVTPAKAP